MPVLLLLNRYPDAMPKRMCERSQYLFLRRLHVSLESVLTQSQCKEAHEQRADKVEKEVKAWQLQMGEEQRRKIRDLCVAYVAGMGVACRKHNLGNVFDALHRR